MSNKVEEKTIVSAEQLALVPKLRFPEFRDAGEWVETPLKVIADPVSERATQDVENNILSLSGEDGLVLQSEYFGKKVAGENSERYLKIVRDDFVYNDRTTKASTYGTIKRLTKYSGGIVSPIYKCFRFNADENPVFWEWYFESGIHDKQLRSLVNEGARAGRFNISISQFLSTAAWRPNEDEQQKIADCLSSIDELLAFEAQKLAVLKAHKKGLMQQLFPAEGETLPKLRFPEFLDAGEWEIIPLSRLAKRSTQKNVHGDQKRVFTNSAEFGIVDQRDFFDKDIANQGNLEGYLIVEKGDYVYNPRISITAPVGPISKNNIATGVMSPLYTVFRFNNSDNDFYAYYFKSTGWHQYMRQASSTGARHDRMAITNDNFLSMPLPAASPEEQQKIVDCLSSLDDLITAQTQKLDTLKTHKKGLMQQLFPVLDEAQE